MDLSCGVQPDPCIVVTTVIALRTMNEPLHHLVDTLAERDAGPHLLRIGAVIALAATSLLILVYLAGLVGFVAWLPLGAAIIAFGLFDVGEWFYRLARRATLREEQGSYVYDDIRLHIHWQDGHCRVEARGLFRVIGFVPGRIEIAKLMHRKGMRALCEEKGRLWFGEEFVLEWLRTLRTRETAPALDKFILWLEREPFADLHRKAQREMRSRH